MNFPKSKYVIDTELQRKLLASLYGEPPVDNLTGPDGQVVQKRQDPRRRFRLRIMHHGSRRTLHLWRKHLSLKCLVLLNDEIYRRAFGLQAQGCDA